MAEKELELRCKAHFTYSLEGIPEHIKNFMEHDFMCARNEAIKLLNPKYDEWNAAYEKEVKGADDQEYLNYIRNKQNEILDKFNETWFGFIKLYSDDQADIAGKYVFGGKVITTIHLSITLI